MQYIYEQNKAVARTFRFDGRQGGVTEYHVIVRATDPLQTFSEQLTALTDLLCTLRKEKLQDAAPVFMRFFVSDAANQAEFVTAQAIETADCALSVVQQPPLDGTKVALWAYLLTDVLPHARPGGLYEAAHGPYRHLWNGNATLPEGDSEAQTRRLLTDYIVQLAGEDCLLRENCLRTWFFVNDIDNHYAGVVKARNEVFTTQGMTARTHFIASTGIGGRTADHRVRVQLDTYAVAGLREGQMRHLYAPTHLNRTSDYGVAFERGTKVDYGDRRHVFISGTASIDNQGNILYPGDIRRQTDRMLENVAALLAEAECTFEDVAHMIVYLRDPADYEAVRRLFAERFPQKPVVLVQAPVCRPGWLIEMECMAVKEIKNETFPNY